MFLCYNELSGVLLNWNDNVSQACNKQRDKRQLLRQSLSFQLELSSFGDAMISGSL